MSFLQNTSKPLDAKSRIAESQPDKSQADQTGSGNGTHSSVRPDNFFNRQCRCGRGVTKASPAVDETRKASPPLGIGSCICTVKNYPMEFTWSPRAGEEPNREVIAAQRNSTRAETAALKSDLTTLPATLRVLAPFGLPVGFRPEREDPHQYGGRSNGRCCSERKRCNQSLDGGQAAKGRRR